MQFFTITTGITLQLRKPGAELGWTMVGMLYLMYLSPFTVKESYGIKGRDKISLNHNLAI